MDDAERYVSNKDDEAVEKLLRPHSVENAVSSDLRLEGNGPKEDDEDDRMSVRSARN